MRKKNLILLTSITGLLLTSTPSQALAQESTITSTNQSSSAKNADDNIRLASEDKCHWNNEIPVPENKYLKLLYDFSKKQTEEYIKVEDIPNSLKEAINNGKISEKEVQYRRELWQELEFKKNYFDEFHWLVTGPFDKNVVKEQVQYVYGDSEDVDKITNEIMDSFSLKEILEYVNEYVKPKYHVIYAKDELRDKYQKEFDELSKNIEYKKEDLNLMAFDTGKFKVINRLDNYSSDEEQINRLINLYRWLEYFPSEKDNINDFSPKKDIESYTSFLASDIPELYELIKEKELDNEKFYSQVDNYMKENYGKLIVEAISKYSEEQGKYISWYSHLGAKAVGSLFPLKLAYTVHDKDIEIPNNVSCEYDINEEPEESTTPTTSTVEDKTETPSTTTTTTDKEEPDTKTTSKEKPEEPVNEDKEDKENNTTTEKPTEKPIEKPIEKENNSNKTPNTISNPNPKPVQQGFTPVNNTEPGTFNGGVSSSVEGEEISNGIKADTGSPNTSILNKIRTIF